MSISEMLRPGEAPSSAQAQGGAVVPGLSEPLGRGTLGAAQLI